MRVPLLFVLALPAVTSLRAQQIGQMVLEPPLSQAFPLTAEPDGIHVAYPVLINDHTVLQPAQVLRFVYVDISNGQSTHHGDATFRAPALPPGGTMNTDQANGSLTHAEGPASAWGDNNTDDHSGLFDVKAGTTKKDRQEAQSEVWRQKDLFVEAFDHAAESGTTVVYAGPAPDHPSSALLDPPEGMLLGEVGGHVRVLALEPDSRPYEAGIRAGDEIRSFGDGQPLVTLDDFLREYTVTKRQARLSGASGYDLTIWRSDEGQVVPVRIEAPPSIPSFL